MRNHWMDAADAGELETRKAELAEGSVSNTAEYRKWERHQNDANSADANEARPRPPTDR